MSKTEALSWSKKWHVVNLDDLDNQSPDSEYWIAVCGTIVFRDTHYPDHLRRIKDGKSKSTGMCRRCSKIVADSTLRDVRELLAPDIIGARLTDDTIATERTDRTFERLGKLIGEILDSLPQGSGVV